MSLEKFFIGSGAHLRRNDAHKIFLNRQAVYKRQPISLNYNLYRSGKTLRFLALPMEIDSYGNIGHIESSIKAYGRKFERIVHLSSPLHLAVA